MKLLSFGEIIWDVYPDKSNIGGASLNLAAHFALQGGNAWLASAVGDDELGGDALEVIEELDIKTGYISVLDGNKTGQSIVSLDADGIPSYKILEDVAYDFISLPEVLDQEYDVIAFGTLALRGEYNRKSIKKALDNNSFKEIYTDLNIRAPFYSRETVEFCLSNATIVKISDEELPTVTQLLFGDDLTPTDSFKKIKESYPNVKLILITQGEKGSLCCDCRADKIYSCEATPANVVSTVGAGDSYSGTFLAWYLKTDNIELSMHLASKVSAYVVSHQEAVPPDTKNFIKTL